MLPKTALLGGPRRGGQQHTIFGAMGHLEASFVEMRMGGEGRRKGIRNNQFKNRKVLTADAKANRFCSIFLCL
jgi:hypothetical protein